MSEYNIYPELSDRMVERWRKTTVHAIAGVRLDPYQEGKRLTFLLQSSQSDFDVSSKTLTFKYDNDVIELYSDAEKRSFKALNKPLFAQGFLAEYTEDTPVVVDNTYTDSDLQSILKLQKVAFSKRINEITSWSTLGRMLPMLSNEDPQWKKDLIEKRLQSLTA